MRIEQTSTGLIIHEPTMEIKQKCLQYFSLKQPLREYFIYSGKDTSKKALFGKEHDVIYITSGFSAIKDEALRSQLSNIKKIPPAVASSITLDMNREPRSKCQEDCIDKMVNSKSSKLTVEAKPGLGKAQPNSTKIPTPTGYTLMGDIKPGDVVFDSHGKLTNVIDVFPQGRKDVYQVTFSDGRQAYCCKEHLWTVSRGKNGHWKVLQLQDMMDDYKEKPPLSFNEDYQYEWDYKYYVPINGRVEFESNNRDTVEEWIENIDFNTDFIPEICKINDIETRKRVTVCLLKTLSRDNSIICPTQSLAYDIRWLINSLGYKTKPIYSNDYGEYIISFDDNLIDNLENDVDNENDSLYITNIEHSHIEQCTCIMVDNDEHLYLTEDFIVTHNTFMTLYAISKLKLKPLIITPSTLLKNQWIENVVELGINVSDIATTIHEAPHKKVCIVTITSLENALRDDWQGLLDLLSISKFGIKIVDESHLHLKGVLKIDAISNIKHNWYLSATLGRSDAAEDRILNTALLDADRFIGGPQYYEYQHQYVTVYYQDITYNASMRICEEYFRYGTKGLVRSTYYNMLMNYKDGVPFMYNIISMIKTAKKIVPEGKILILVPLISTIIKLLEIIDKDPYFSRLSTAGVDGSLSINEKRKNLESDIIISTSMSMGVGVDVSNLAAVINFDQYSSLIITEQIVGRLRDRGKQTHYFDICDHVKYARTIESWGNKRRSCIPYFPGVDPNIKLLKHIQC